MLVKNMDYNIVAEHLELLDPNPNIWDLFRQFDMQFFEETLSRHCVELTWSPQMTRTAGLCAWNPRTTFCNIRLSLPLLQLRSRRDLIETLLHEMIHGFLFVTRQDDNHESHGEKFHYHMYRINQMTGTKISVYHTFHDEVRSYQTHVWKCDGPCQNRRPFFGLVKRAMNRKPGPNDSWWKQHQETCGGTYHKIAEPDPKLKPKALAQPKSKRPPSTAASGQKRLNSTQLGGGDDNAAGPSGTVPTVNGTTKSTKKTSSPKSIAPPNSKQRKISDYWSSIGPGRKLCD